MHVFDDGTSNLTKQAQGLDNFGMHKHIISLLLLLPIFNLVYAAGSVRFADLEDDIGPGAESLVRVNNGGGSFFFAEYQVPGGDGTASSSPGQTWLPFKNGGGQENNVTITNGVTLVPDIAGTTGQFQTLLEIRNGTNQDQYLYAAVQDPNDSGSFKVITSAGGPFASQASSYLSWRQILINNLCGSIDCTNLESGTTATKNVLIYFFLDPQSNRGLDTPVNASSQSGGVFLRLYMSVRLPTSVVNLNELRRGDGRLIATFSSSTISDPNRTLAVINGQGGGMAAGDVQTALTVPGSQLLDLESTSTSGEITIKPLVNGVTYEAVLLLEDKFQLATQVSAPLTETPQAIEALLEKQACYILSAGFQEEHFITNYFRKLRDKILLKTALGTDFVDWYYKTAPRYTPFIYSSPVVAFIVRCLAFMAWFLINLTLVCTPIVLIIFTLKKLSNRKSRSSFS